MRWNHDSSIIVCCYGAANNWLAVGNVPVHMIMATATNNEVMAISSFKEDLEHIQDLIFIEACHAQVIVEVTVSFMSRPWRGSAAARLASRG